jgi:hypothetical protein
VPAFNPKTSSKLSFVLTVALSDTGRDDLDFQRLRILFKSFSKFFPRENLSQFLVVTPRRDVLRVTQLIKNLTNLSGFTIVPEDELCPELLLDPPTTNEWPRPNKGWFRQQLIKLAAHELVSTPFYMTLDSDVIFVKKFEPADIMIANRSVVNRESAADYALVYKQYKVASTVADKNRYVSWAERVLRTSRAGGGEWYWYGETPTILSRNIVCSLTKEIERVYGTPWREVLISNLPWTEYGLYFVYAEKSNMLTESHILGNRNSIVRNDDSLFAPANDYLDNRDLQSWNSREAFRGDKAGIVVVVQSYLGYPVRDLESKVMPYL